MARYRLIAGFAMALSLLAGGRAAAQDTGATILLGAEATLGSLPRAFNPDCARRSAGATPMLALGGGIGLRRGALSVESHTAFTGEFGPFISDECLAVLPIYEDGPHTDRWPGVERGGFVATDVRARYAFGAARRLSLAVGGGWLWGRHVPYLVASPAISIGHGVRAVVAGEVRAYRIPMDLVTTNWKNWEYQGVISRTREHNWRTSVGLNVGIEVPVETL